MNKDVYIYTDRWHGVDAELLYYYNRFINSTVSPSRGTVVTSLAAGVFLLSPTVRAELRATLAASRDEKDANAVLRGLI